MSTRFKRPTKLEIGDRVEHARLGEIGTVTRIAPDRSWATVQWDWHGHRTFNFDSNCDRLLRLRTKA